MTQVWNLDYTGTHTGLIHLTFHYNPDLLPPGFDQTKLTIRHFTNGAWEELVGNVDTVKHTIKVSTASLSPFALATATPGLIPALTAARPSPGTLNLSWPADQTGWVLQESTDLITWVDSARAVTTSGGAKSVTINGTGGCCFFRLAHP